MLGRDFHTFIKNVLFSSGVGCQYNIQIIVYFLWALRRHIDFIVFYLLISRCLFIYLFLLPCRFEKLQEDAFTYAFVLKSLNMIPALGN